MKKLIFSLALAVSVHAFAQQYNIPAVSPRQTVEQQFSVTKISVEYGRPAVKGRKVFGELVPFGQVWRAGANEATKITFGQEVLFGGQKVKKGTYALYIVPQEKEWKIILNRGVNNWGAYTYDAKEDVATTTVPVKMMNEKMERFTINFEDITDEKLNLVFEWDKTRADVPVEILNVEETLQIIDNLKAIKKVESDIKKKNEPKK
ncbi:MAG TPA: hypothetical protein DIT47_08435 [Flavobacteriaceae bacterium]|nr:hypothetical protein [Flavobacteriaceae bacterium]